MVQRSRRWYLLGDERDRPQKKNYDAKDAERPVGRPQCETAANNTDAAKQRFQDGAYRAKERAFWKRQITAASALNIITVGAAGTAVVGLIFVHDGLVEAKRATVEANRAWLTVTGMMDCQRAEEKAFKL